jgi:pimeloyl-ACP methyl ester carboxylesterase
MPVRHVVYLHGFASSPASSKAAWFARELEALGIGFSCPDFNQPSFETLTVTRMVNQTLEAVEAAGEGPVALVGSSLGGYVAVHAAAKDAGRRGDRLVLLAPAFDFGGNRLKRLGPHDVETWRRDGRVHVFHYAYSEARPVSFALYEDAAAWDAFDVQLDIPVLIVHGRRDDVVDPAMVQEWAAGRPNVTLHLVDDGHQLTDSMPFIWEESRKLFEA